MSLPERRKMNVTLAVRALALGGLIAAGGLVSACTVRPLYSNAPLSAGSQVGAAAELASIAVKPVTTRYAQQVRNNLIFAFTGGAGEPASPAYSLNLGVTELVQSAALIQVTTNEDTPTAGTVTLKAAYTLTDAKTGKTVSSGRRSITSSFDRPLQEFASYRAQRDAEDRAARELSDLLHIAVAQDLAKR
ncbi:MAG TPA: LPS assembly lipoprotein LptE [Mesorhizobium sp.]